MSERHWICTVVHIGLHEGWDMLWFLVKVLQSFITINYIYYHYLHLLPFNYIVCYQLLTLWCLLASDKMVASLEWCSEHPGFAVMNAFWIERLRYPLSSMCSSHLFLRMLVNSFPVQDVRAIGLAEVGWCCCIFGGRTLAYQLDGCSLPCWWDCSCGPTTVGKVD